MRAVMLPQRRCIAKTSVTHLVPAQVGFHVWHSLVAACRKEMLAVEAILYQEG